MVRDCNVESSVDWVHSKRYSLGKGSGLAMGHVVLLDLGCSHMGLGDGLVRQLVWDVHRRLRVIRKHWTDRQVLLWRRPFLVPGTV